MGQASRLGVIALLLLVGCTCKSGSSPAGGAPFDPPGEPYEYSATVVTTIEKPSGETTSSSRVARSGEKRREDWSENGKTTTLIWRPDLGKSFLLDSVQKAFVESELNPAESSAGNDAESIERAIEGTQPALRTESRALPSRTIDGHRCNGFETIVTNRDGTSRVTRLFRGEDLDIAIRIEVVQGDHRMVIERRHIQTVVDPALFEVPPDFKRVTSLGHH
jgi:hypothetical protein